MAFEEEGQPERERGTSGWEERFNRTLEMVSFGGVERKQFGGALTPSSSRPSRRWRGTIVTVSISARKAISEAVTPRGRGKAIESANRKMKAI